MIVLGLDGFRFGWVAVRLEDDRRSIAFPATLSEALSGAFDRAFIDIPIGMSDDGERLCDRLAREKLKPHGSRVFSGARRWLWQDFTDPDKANAKAVKRNQKKVSRQLWHIGTKIMETDAFVRAHRTLEIAEAHPELVFLKLNNGVPLASKHTDEGLALRRKILASAGFAELDEWLDRSRSGTGAKEDDVLDACACAIAARDIHLGNCLPKDNAPEDAYGLPMRIWY